MAITTCDNEITYVPDDGKGPGYVAYDARGNVCGFVSEESMRADLAYRERRQDENNSTG